VPEAAEPEPGPDRWRHRQAELPEGSEPVAEDQLTPLFLNPTFEHGIWMRSISHVRKWGFVGDFKSGFHPAGISMSLPGTLTVQVVEASVDIFIRLPGAFVIVEQTEGNLLGETNLMGDAVFT